MSLQHLRNLSMNSHLFGTLIQCFLSGYTLPCDIKVIFTVLPIILNAQSREKLAKANSRSRLDTLFGSSFTLDNGSAISDRTRFSGYKERYDLLNSHTKKALIILYSKGKIVLNSKTIEEVEILDYHQFEHSVKEWAKSAYYLGRILRKTDQEHLNYFLGVDDINEE